MLEFYSSSTSVVDPKRAAAECLEKALGNQKNLDCDLIIMYTAVGHNLKALVSEVRKLSPHARVVGTTCAGVIGREGPNESMKALAIMAIKGGEGEFAIASKPPLGIQLSKRAMRNGLNSDFNSLNDHAYTLFRLLVGSEDFAEAMKALGEKREPQFKGK